MELFVTHNDLDGIAGAIVALYHKYGGDIYIAPNPQQIPKDVLMKYDKITITDLSPSDELMKALILNGKKVVVYDHHAAAAHIQAYEGCTLDVNRCGSRIYAESFGDANLVEFVRRVDLWDRFVHSDPDFKLGVELNDLFNGYNRLDRGTVFGFIEDTRFNKFIDRILTILEGPFEYNDEDRAIIKREESIYLRDYKTIQSTLNKRTDSHGFKFAVCDIPKNANTSLILNNMQKAEGLSYIIGFAESPSTEFVRISARAIDTNVDLNKLKFLNGHPLAAGGQLRYNFAMKLREGKINAIDYK